MNKSLKTGIAVVVALAVTALFFIYSNPLAFFGESGSIGQSGQLLVQDETIGTGEEARPGDILTVNYTGRLQDGTVFDTSSGEEPPRFMIGAGLMIQGWEQGLPGMRQGGKRLLIIPPEMAYGEQGRGPIPPNATLIFEVELVKVERPQ